MLNMISTAVTSLYKSMYGSTQRWRKRRGQKLNICILITLTISQAFPFHTCSLDTPTFRLEVWLVFMR